MNNELFFDSEDFSYPNARTPSGRKTLNEIFDVGSKKEEKESLHYTPPRSDTTKNESTASHQMLWSTRLAKIVIGFKNGETVGRVGVAILRNIENAYRILVYKTKTNLLATYTIQENTNAPHIHRQNCYWQFYDDDGFYWSLLFERTSDETDFINKLKESGIRVQLDVEVSSTSAKNFEDRKKSELRNEKSQKLTTLPEENQLKMVEPEAEAEEDVVEEMHTPTNEQQDITNDNLSDRTKILVRLPKIDGVQPLSTFKDSSTIGIGEASRELIDHTTSLTIVGHSRTYPTNSEVHTQYVFPVQQASSVAAASSSTVFSPAEAQMMQMMLVENRTQNAELRINIDKLEAKIEKVMEKLSMLQVGSEHSEDFFRLEEKILALKKENRRLKRETKTYNCKNGVNYESVYNIYGTELTNLGIDVDPNCPADVDAIIGELIDRVTFLTTQLEDKETHLKNVSNALRDQKERNQLDRKTHIRQIDELEQAQRKIEMLQTSLDKRRDNEIQLNARISELKSQHASHLNNVKSEMTETLKDIMNTVYHNLAENIVNMDKLLPDKILALIGKTIRQDTLNAVAKISK